MSTALRPIVLTFDTDWAPAFMLEAVLALLGDTPATFFVTDAVARDVCSAAPAGEIGLHPNFLPGSSHGETRREVLEHVLRLAPEARVVRGHNLFQDTTVLDLYAAYGLAADLSLLEYQNPAPRPFRYWNGLVRLPYNWGDDLATVLGEPRDDRGWLWASPVLVPTFHPVHVYLNTDTLDRYTALRNAGPMGELTPAQAAEHVNRERPGVRDVLVRLLSEIHRGERRAYTTSEFLATQPIAPWASAPFGSLTARHNPARADL
jgi:hypothetical protein